MLNALSSGLTFLFSVAIDFYLYILFIRLVAHWVGLPYTSHQLLSMIYTFTQWIIRPLSFIPNTKLIESSTALLLLLLAILKFYLIGIINIGMPALFGILLAAIGDILMLACNAFFYAILIQAILTWVQPLSPMTALLAQLVSPVMRPFQKWIPLINGIDISPIPALIFLQFVIITIANPLLMNGTSIAYGLL